MLVYQEHRDIVSLLCEIHKCFLNRGRFGLGIDDEEIPLGVWSICDMLFYTVSTEVAWCGRLVLSTYPDARQQESRHGAENTLLV